METIVAQQTRVIRREPEILHLLDEFAKSNISVKDFCKTNGISAATFYNWRNRYGTKAVEQTAEPGFATLQITATTPESEAVLFAEVNGIRIYQPVPASYLKELRHE
jgi:transposase-like protein